MYKLEPSGQETVLYSFTGGADGSYPYAGVIRDSAGNLYGTTSAGGTSGAGVVYKLNTSGQETVLYSFTGGADGGSPYAGVIADSAGNLYGTAEFGGTSSAGVVYKVNTTGQETVLYTFTGGADGGYPAAGVIRNSEGNLFGTTIYGGNLGSSLDYCYGCGVVYKLDTSMNETVLYAFTGGADGGYPDAGVIADSAGNLYGTTNSGSGTAVLGAVYKLNTAGQETSYPLLAPPDGSDVYPGVIRDEAGNLYGTAYEAGTGGYGVVFKLDPAGQETVLYSFTGWPNGVEPQGVIGDSAGNLYGITYNGGTASGLGLVYELTQAGQETVLHSFAGGTGDGIFPSGGLLRDSAGNLYGATEEGGPSGFGVVYKLNTSGQETILYSFTGYADGGFANGWLVLDSAGNLYGTAAFGGTGFSDLGYGVVYKLSATGQETVLYTFTGGADGGSPYAGVIRDPAGNLYGTTYGGGSGYGVVYKLNTAGQETVLHTFTGGADGGYPSSGVIRDSAGNLYGTTSSGGTSGAGVVYKVSTSGQETVLYNFTGGNGGSGPSGGVITDSAGNLYGTAGGGKNLGGVVFELIPQ